MKKVLFLMTLLVMGVSFAFAQTNADIKFDKTTHDFGKFSENSPVVSCTFTFTNIGDAPLVIHQAVASCGCTVPDYTKEPILPGQKGKITLKFDSASFDGLVSKQAEVYANVEKSPIVISFSADIQP